MLPPPECLFSPIDFPRKLLMGAGPSNSSPRILAASALPLLGYQHSEFIKIMDEVKEGIRYVFQTKNTLTLAICGSAHAAMEAVCCNMVEDGDVVLVACNGIWGRRFSEMIDRHGGDVRSIDKPMGQILTLKEIEEGLIVHRPALMFITQGESSGSTLQPLEGVGDLCHKYNCLLIVDVVATMGGVPLFTDEWQIDVVYAGSQKALSAPPGVSPISFNDKAWDKIKNRKSKVRSYYFDMNELGNHWGCDQQRRRYHHTSPISNIYALREALAVVAEEGLNACWARHMECANLLYDGLEELGLKLYVDRKEDRLPTVTAIEVPEGVDWKSVPEYTMQKYNVEMSTGISSLYDKIWRVGVMGYNAKPDNVRMLLRALKDALKQPNTMVNANAV